MEKFNAVVDFLFAHKMLLSTLILVVVWLVRRVVLSYIRGDVAFITEKQRKWMSRTKNGASIQRASSRSFRIGDWIEVGSISGEVIEHNMMATVIQEIALQKSHYHYVLSSSGKELELYEALCVS